MVELRMLLHADRAQRREDSEYPRLVDKRLVGGVGTNLLFEHGEPELLDICQQVLRLILAIDDVSIVTTRKQLVDACHPVFEWECCDTVGGALVVDRC